MTAISLVTSLLWWMGSMEATLRFLHVAGKSTAEHALRHRLFLGLPEYNVSVICVIPCQILETSSMHMTQSLLYIQPWSRCHIVMWKAFVAVLLSESIPSSPGKISRYILNKITSSVIRLWFLCEALLQSSWEEWYKISLQ